MIQNIRYLVLFLVLILSANCQIRRDIIYQYLSLDQNNDYLLSKQELMNHLTNNQTKNNYYTFQDYLQKIYPNNFWKQYDQDKDNKISSAELAEIIKKKWTKYVSIIPNEVNNHLEYLDQKQYLRVCDKNKDQFLESQQLPACINAALFLQKNSYPWKIKSLLYQHDNIGYDVQVFIELMKKLNNQEDPSYEQHLKQLFNMFEWDNNKIQKDDDDMVGPEQGKFMQPVIVMMNLDRLFDGILSKDQVFPYLDKYGGEQIFKLMDIDNNNKLDIKQFVSYYAFAFCIDCSSKLLEPNIEDSNKINQEQSSQQNQQNQTKSQQNIDLGNHHEEKSVQSQEL